MREVATGPDDDDPQGSAPKAAVTAFGVLIDAGRGYLTALERLTQAQVRQVMRHVLSETQGTPG